ncbi:hypothetical protein L3Q82_000553 [Scortum barcoo]|uniref:Uncharacterized protein n=1 Tax=Scortum barcoo TaxID=214431 RepID=A0ACB8WI79_9TELE|nr:hypothetical protein L3Q82_000553 [Scortum barcoo]
MGGTARSRSWRLSAVVVGIVSATSTKSSLASPEKVRAILTEGVSSADIGLNRCADESRIAEISRQLQTQHEKFCPWPDFPCPERFWLVPACEPSALLSAFLERFKSACLLAQQLPAMKPEQLKSMSLTEDVISVILQLIEEEQKRKAGTPCSEPLAVQVAACIVSLCGWAASPALHAMNLPILTCSYCMRKVGLWNFHQMEGTGSDGDASSPTGEGTSSPVALRARSRDSPSPSEDLPSPLTRGKRSATRGRGQGDNAGADGTASLHNPPKRLCLSSVGGPGPRDKSKRVFDIFRQWQPYSIESKHEVTILSGLNEFVVKFFGPQGTPYEGGVWKVRVDLPDKYPFKSPSIGFMNKIFHPNIDEASGTVCLDVINQTWTALYDLTNIFESFLPQLLAYPNPIDPLNGDAAAMYLHRPEEYKQKIKEYIQKYATEEALKEQEEGAGDSSSESSMSDFSEDEAQDMEL